MPCGKAFPFEIAVNDQGFGLVTDRAVHPDPVGGLKGIPARPGIGPGQPFRKDMGKGRE